MKKSIQAGRGSLQPLDRAVAIAVLILLVLTGLLLFGGDQTAPQVRTFSWSGRQLSKTDVAMTFDFNRPMNTKSVADQLRFEPALPGRLSWAGRRMAYTPDLPPQAGTEYQVRLTQAQDRFGRAMARPFESQFSTPTPRLLYLSIAAENAGRLMRYDFATAQTTAVTPPNLVVSDFKPYPDGKRVLFSAAERTAAQQGTDYNQLQLYQIDLETGQLSLQLDSRDYQLLRFALSPDGKAIVVQRFDRKTQQPQLDQPIANAQSSLGLWLQREGDPQWSLISNQATGEFLITPDSSALIIAQGQGQTIFPLTPKAKALEFLPRFGTVLNFAADGTQAAMVQFNPDYTRDLFLVSTAGQPRKLLHSEGNFKTCEFNLNRTTLYCVVTRVVGKGYDEYPALVAIDLKTGQLQTLLELNERTDLNFNLAPDQRSLLYDRVSLAAGISQGVVRSLQGEPIAVGEIWQLPLKPEPSEPIPLKLLGIRPLWLP
ncbi:Ig-like domain-containing protein [Leptolyngbya sp. FACHB-261]|uniref:Ig-like domain-containing protein n=1 Tax=Leptolyngbya sp. FACHB-261 TaxID=2692806 RepID=UPI001686BB40|nr:Ig-like domain-containing protein [Leptolyngbya sp. FACHB-261]MBD2103327.1 hypothetical protein [Leptolyngbya sp. FACHB-261]